MSAKKGKSSRKRVVPPLASRAYHSDHLHRAPCRWDVLVHDLGVALAKGWWSVRGRLATPELRPANEQLRTVGWMLGRGAEIVIQQGLLDDPAWAAAFDEGRIDDDLAGSIARASGERCFDPLIRHDVWITDELILPRPDRDLDRLVAALTEAMNDFLLSRCAPGGDRHDCITEPLAPAGDALPDNHKPRHVASPSARASVEIPRLALRFDDNDDAGEVKGKLLHFIRNDPWLFTELIAAIDERAIEESDRDSPDVENVNAMVVSATDDFLVRATSVDGKTPAELLLARQRDLAPAQARRISRMCDDAFSSMFHVRFVGMDYLDAIDLRTDREYRLVATRPQALARAHVGSVFQSRVVPWDDAWYLSGLQRSYTAPDQPSLAAVRAELRQRPPGGRPDRESEAYRKAMSVQAEQYKVWVELFGADELLFSDGRELRAAVDRFYHHWSFEMVVPELGGRTRAQDYEREKGKLPPELQIPVPQELLDSRDVAVVFDPLWGMCFLNDFGEFSAAFTSSGPPSASALRTLRAYLINDSIDPVIFERMRQRHPDRTEQVMRAVLRDEQFQLDRDFEPTMRRFKPELMRIGPTPTVTLV